MNNVNEDQPIVFQTRWAMSYFRGPLTRDQIKVLMDPIRSQFATAADEAGHGGKAAKAEKSASNRPILPAGIREAFLPVVERVPDGYSLEYRAGLLGSGKVHFTRASDGIDVWRECHLLQPMRETPPDDIWDQSQEFSKRLDTETEPDAAGTFAALPSELAREKSYSIFGRQLEEHLYRESTLELLQCELLDSNSRPGESRSDFLKRLEPLLRREAQGGARSARNTVCREVGEFGGPHQIGRRPGEHAEVAILDADQRLLVGDHRGRVAIQGHGPARAGRVRRKWRCAGWRPNGASKFRPKRLSTSCLKKRNR